MKVELPAAEDSSPTSALSRIPFHLSSSSSEDEKCASERSSEDSSDAEYADVSHDHSARSSSDVDSEDGPEDDRWDVGPRGKKRKTACDAGTATPHSDGHVQKKRNENRKVGSRIYDSVLGRTCHWCRQKTVEDHAECSRCPIRFCGACLSNRNGEKVLVEMDEAVKWICPKCRGGCGPGCKNCCNCGPCRKTQNLEPTGQCIQVARRFGFNNVHDYLIHLKTNESPAVIAARKDGRGWTKSTGALVKEGRRWTKNTGTRVNKSLFSDEEEDYSSGEDVVVKQEFVGNTESLTKDKIKREKIADTRIFEESSATEGLDDASQVLNGPADSNSDPKLGDKHFFTSQDTDKDERSADTRQFKNSSGMEGLDNASQVLSGPTGSKTYDKLGEKVEQSSYKVSEKERATQNHNAKHSTPIRSGAKTRKVKLAPDTKILEEDLISTVVSEVSESGHGSFGCMSGIDFARKLECTLQRPFSTLQLNQMQKHVNARKPVMETRHVRNRTIQVPGSTEGLSYLDHYPDFAEELDKARLPEEKLKLLRGFFFWLQHPSMEGTFRPWAKRGNVTETTGGDCVEISGPDCEVICVLLAIDEDDANHPVECEDIKPQIKVFQSAPHQVLKQSATPPTVKVKIEKE